MMNAKRMWAGRLSLLALGAALMLSAFPGCEKKKPPPPPPPPPPKKVVKATPDPVDINGVMSAVKPDGRVQFPQSHAPADRSLAEATIKLASALAKGDAKEFGAMLDPGAKAILEELVSSGGWGETTKKIEQVRVVSLTNTGEEKPGTASLGLAVQVPGQAFLLGWSGTRVGDAWLFKNAWADGATKTRASEFDGASVGGGPSAAASEPSESEAPASASAGPASRKSASGAKPEAKPAADPDADKKKNTPVGPVTIPGTGKGRGTGGN